MEDEHEMCPNCHRDVPVRNYRAHVLHCRRHVVRCPDCGIAVSKEELEQHRNDNHALQTCDMCHVHIEASKLQEHQQLLCPQKPSSCSFCPLILAASEVSEHERRCGQVERACPICGKCVLAKNLKEHLRTVHSNEKSDKKEIGSNNDLGQSRFRQLGREQKATSTGFKRCGSESNLLLSSTNSSETLLPCEFCEGLVPSHKLLEHQAACVNPTNVRARSVSRTSSFNVGSSALSRSNSLNWRQNSIRRRPSFFSDNNSQDYSSGSRGRDEELLNEARIKCELCGESMSREARKWHKLLCEPRRTATATTFLSYRRGYCTLNRTGSYRETRATTEERQPFGTTAIRRRGSFNENNDRAQTANRRAVETTKTNRGLCRSSSYSSELTSIGSFESRATNPRPIEKKPVQTRPITEKSLESFKKKCNVDNVKKESNVDTSEKENNLDKSKKENNVDKSKKTTLDTKESNVSNMESIRTKVTMATSKPLKSAKSLSQRRVSFTDEMVSKPKLSKDALLLHEVSQRLRDEQTPESPPIIMSRLDKQLFSNDTNENTEKTKIDMKSADVSPIMTSASCSSEASPAIQRSKNVVAIAEPDEDDSMADDEIDSNNGRDERAEIGKSNGGTVQNLAQDLAAECAKAYALMENSLSRLSTDLPFGLTVKRPVRNGRGARS